MSAGKISWMIDENDWMTIIKVDVWHSPLPPRGRMPPSHGSSTCRNIK